MNFTLVDKAIIDGGIQFVDYFLNRTDDISKLELDEYLDTQINSFCIKLKIN